MNSFPSIHFFNYPSFTVSEEELQKHAADRFEIHPQKERFAHFAHKASQILSLPFRKDLHLLCYAIEPLPGKDKEQKWYGVAKRVSCLVLGILLLPTALLCLPLTLPFHLYSHCRRTAVSYIPSQHREINSPQNHSTISIRTHNLGFIPKFMGIAGDLRDAKKRAQEIASQILQDKNAPDIICFQEAFHLEATEILCNALSPKYNIIHNIFPHFPGEWNQGTVFASVYPIEQISARQFTNLLGPEKLTSRGLTSFRIRKDEQTIDIYTTHLQALLGKKRAQVREEQMEQIIDWMDEDRRKNLPNKPNKQVLVGDLNISTITAWGEENHEDDETLQTLNKHFVDLFRNDHDADGNRIKGTSHFAKENETEPTGTWCVGPFADKGLALKAKEKFEQIVYKNGPKKQKFALSKDHGWGTKAWPEKKKQTTARFDYILGKIEKGNAKQWEQSWAEILPIRTKEQSNSSDHLAVQAEIILN